MEEWTKLEGKWMGAVVCDCAWVELQLLMMDYKTDHETDWR